MATIVVLGADLGGVLMAFEVCHHARNSDTVVVVSNTDTYQFVPSNS